MTGYRAPARELLLSARLKAVIDWVEVVVTLPRRSQFRHVQARLLERFGEVYVEALDYPTSSSRFKFRIQNPLDTDAVMCDLQCLSKPGEPAIAETDVVVCGIEISLDAYMPNCGFFDLVLATTHLFKHHASPPAGFARITEPRRYRAAVQQKEVIAALGEGWSVNGGAKNGDYATRGYVKTKDSTLEDGPYAELEPLQHRARFEVTLRGRECPFDSMESWRAFKFQSLARRFAMIVPDTQVPLMQVMQAHVAQLGRRPDSYKRRTSDRKKGPPGTRRDSELNERIRMALRGLTAAQRCQNSGLKKVGESSSTYEDGHVAVVNPKYLNTHFDAKSPQPHSIPLSGQSDLTNLINQIDEYIKADTSAVKMDEWSFSYVPEARL